MPFVGESSSLLLFIVFYLNGVLYPSNLLELKLNIKFEAFSGPKALLKNILWAAFTSGVSRCDEGLQEIII